MEPLNGSESAFAQEASTDRSAIQKGKLVLLIGPSGVGKSAILRTLRTKHADFHFPRSATTRARREGEGAELYHFLSDAEFDQLLSENKVLEWAIVHGGARYATIVDEIVPYIEQGKTVVREVDVQGFDAISHHPLFSGDHPEYTLQSIFIVPENTEQLIRRIQNRAPISDEELERRVESMDKELLYADQCTNKVINHEGKLEETIEEVESLILEK